MLNVGQFSMQIMWLSGGQSSVQINRIASEGQRPSCVVRRAMLYKSRQRCDCGVLVVTEPADQMFIARCDDGLETRYLLHAGRRN